MVNYISGLVFVILLLVGGAVVAPLATFSPVLAVVVVVVWLIADAIVSTAIQLAAQWQRAVVFRLGKFKDTRGPAGPAHTNMLTHQSLPSGIRRTSRRRGAS
jgi:hypothetical protein